METNIQQTQVTEVVNQSGRPRRKHLKLVFVILGIIVLVLVLFNFFYPSVLSLFFGEDLPQSDYADLQISSNVVPENQNAYYDLIKLDSNKIFEPLFVFDYLADKATWDQSVVSDVWQKNQESFQIFYSAISKDKFQNPNTDQQEDLAKDTVITPMIPWKSMARLSAIRAYYFQINNQNKEAMNEALNLIKLGHMIQQSQTDLITFLVGTTIKSQGLDVLVKIKPSLSAEDKTFLTSELQKYTANTFGLEFAYKIDFWSSNKAIDNILAGTYQEDYGPDFDKLRTMSFYFKPNLTKSYYEEMTRNEIADIGNCTAQQQGPPRFQSDVDSGHFKKIFTENFVGKIIYTVSEVSDLSTSMNTKVCDQQSLIAQISSK